MGSIPFCPDIIIYPGENSIFTGTTGGRCDMPGSELCDTSPRGKPSFTYHRFSRKVKGKKQGKGKRCLLLGGKCLASNIAPLTCFHQEEGNFQIQCANTEEKAICLPVRNNCVLNANTSPDTLFLGKRSLLQFIHGRLREVP